MIFWAIMKKEKLPKWYEDKKMTAIWKTNRMCIIEYGFWTRSPMSHSDWSLLTLINGVTSTAHTGFPVGAAHSV